MDRHSTACVALELGLCLEHIYRYLCTRHEVMAAPLPTQKSRLPTLTRARKSDVQLMLVGRRLPWSTHCAVGLAVGTEGRAATSELLPEHGPALHLDRGVMG